MRRRQMRPLPNRPCFWFACLVVGVPTFARSTVAVEPAVSQVRVIYNFTPFSAVGRKKAGLLCVPNGKMTWSDIAPPNPQMINTMMQSALRQEEAKIKRRQIWGSITALLVEVNLSACAKQWAFGDRDTYKGGGQITVEWQAEGAQANRTDRSVKIISTFKLDGTMPPLEVAFGAAAHDYMMAVASEQ